MSVETANALCEGIVTNCQMFTVFCAVPLILAVFRPSSVCIWCVCVSRLCRFHQEGDEAGAESQVPGHQEGGCGTHAAGGAAGAPTQSWCVTTVPTHLSLCLSIFLSFMSVY